MKRNTIYSLLKRFFLIVPLILLTSLLSFNVAYGDDSVQNTPEEYTASENTSYDFSYKEVKQYGHSINNNTTALFKLLSNDSTEYYAYCVDHDTVIKKDYLYSRDNLSNSNYFSKDMANKIRGIITKAFPFISLEELQKNTGIKNLTEKEAITATQMAVWHFSNNDNFENIKAPNIASLYEYYLNINPLPEDTIKIGAVETSIDTKYIYKTGNAGTYTSTIRYKTDATNIDGSPVELAYFFDKNIEESYPSVKIQNQGVDSQGFNVIQISNLPKDASFTFTAYGVQSVGFDAYFYTPKGGRLTSQSLVGAYEGQTNISSNVSFVPIDIAENTIQITKIDSTNGAPLPGAVFEISDSKDFENILFTVVTGEDGTVTQGGLDGGEYFIRETKAPNGYICYEEPFSVSVGDGITLCECKNTPFSSIELLKTDDNDTPLANAKFSIYSGDNISDQPLRENLVSNEDGIILISDLIPGTYTIVETEAPKGYRLSSKPITITVAPGQCYNLKFTNEKLKDSHINIIKKDAYSKLTLSGATFGIYLDPEFKELLQEITTTENYKSASSDKNSSKDGSSNYGASIDLPSGTYYIKELTAPSGYLNDSQPQTITIGEDETIELVFYDHKIPKTAGNYALTLIIGLTMLGITVILLIAFRKKLFRLHEK